MVGELGFPKGLISVERAIGDRRYDILVFSREMMPLLLIECKAHSVNEATFQQALGYNETVKAPFFSLCGVDGVKTFWHEKDRVQSVPFLPKFEELYEVARRL